MSRKNGATSGGVKTKTYSAVISAEDAESARLMFMNFLRTAAVCKVSILPATQVKGAVRGASVRFTVVGAATDVENFRNQLADACTVVD